MVETRAGKNNQTADQLQLNTDYPPWLMHTTNDRNPLTVAFHGAKQSTTTPRDFLEDIHNTTGTH